MRLAYRTVTPSKGRWPEWLRTLGKRSGVYVIRSARTHKILYVGESHTGRLRSTLQRHFWDWRGKTAGVTYAPETVEVAIVSTPPPAAVSAQNRLISRLKPRDNELTPGNDPF